MGLCQVEYLPSKQGVTGSSPVGAAKTSTISLGEICSIDAGDQHTDQVGEDGVHYWVAWRKVEDVEHK